MWTTGLAVVLLAYIPGALTFRLPFAHRERRASLRAEERLFWYVVVSVVITSLGALILAAFGSYRFDRLLWINGALSAALALVGRGRLRLSPEAPAPGWTALIPATIVGVSLFVVFYVPPSEYVMGGRDPGVYLNEGIQIAQHGTFTVAESVVESVPRQVRHLFFRDFSQPSYFSSRFMGFFLLDPDQGTVTGQFPHLYPVWIAIGYGINGLSGARHVIGLWAILGVVAVYFSGAWLLGRPAAAVGSLLLVFHVAQVWYSRYPNAEMPMQALLFAGMLAFGRGHVEDNRFFAPLAAILVTLALFAHLTAVLAVGALFGASLLGALDGHRPRLAFLVPLLVGFAAAATYYVMVLPHYLSVPLSWVSHLQPPHLALIALGLAAGMGTLWAARTDRRRLMLRRWVPRSFLAALLVLAGYAYFLRAPGPGLGRTDAASLRTFTEFYLTPLGLIAALLGLAVVVHRAFWRGLGFLLTLAIYACFFFFKLRIIPEHFWTARRFLAVVIPAALLLIGAAALLPSSLRLPSRSDRRSVRAVLYGVSVVVVIFFGQQYLTATQPILTHVEYAGLIPRLEALAARFEETDLLLVESRRASDMHVLATPLAYIYGRNVLVLASPRPNGRTFLQFLQWAKGHYRRVFFMGGGGTLVLSRSITAVPIASERFQIPEYEQPRRTYPRGVRHKEFDFGVYELRPERVSVETFDLDVGTMDDLFVRRFHAKERHSSGTSFRWTRSLSLVAIMGVSPEKRVLTLWLNDGGRPDHLPPATAALYLNDRLLGTVIATSAFEPHRVEVPVDLAEELAASEIAGELRIESSTWNPGQILGVSDRRDVGVMVDRITLDAP